VTVGFAEDQWNPQRHRCEPARTRDVPAPAKNRLCAAGAKGTAGGRQRPGGEAQGANRPEGFRAIDAANVQQVDFVARGRDKLGLGAIAGAEE